MYNDLTFFSPCRSGGWIGKRQWNHTNGYD